MLILQAVVLLLFNFAVHFTIPAIVTLFVIGALSLATVPASQLYVVQTAERFNPAIINVASAFNIASFNAGAALGAYAGGLVVSSVFGLQATPMEAAIFMAISIIMVLISSSLEKKQ